VLDRMASRQRYRCRFGLAGSQGQALVEAALVLPLLLILALGVVGVGRVVQAQIAVHAVSRETARAAAQANSASEAVSRGVARGQVVASGYQLTNGSLQLSVDPGPFARGGQVLVVTRYEVALGDLPLLGWLGVSVTSQHTERIDPYRSRWPAGGVP
jgi:Flp pilus assembly protein TadG